MFKREKLNSERIEELLNYYRHLPIESLRLIEAKWAYGKNRNKTLDPDLHPSQSRYLIYLAVPPEIISNAELGDLQIQSLFTGQPNNDVRITRILYRWQNDYFVDPPIIGRSNLDRNRLWFSDGRHRTKLSFILQLQKIPIAINKDDLKEVGSIIKLEAV